MREVGASVSFSETGYADLSEMEEDGDQDVFAEPVDVASLLSAFLASLKTSAVGPPSATSGGSCQGQPSSLRYSVISPNVKLFF